MYTTTLKIWKTLLVILSGFVTLIKAQDTSKPLNLAYQYNDFHISFALVGFTTLLIVLAVFLVSLGMWNLNPGRDSIIYRMTSQRKKDQ